MKNSRSMFATTFKDNCIYVVGGIDKEKKEMSECEMYDMNTNQWVDMLKLNHARSSASLIVTNNDLYVFGGYPIGVPIEKYSLKLRFGWM